MRIHKNRFVRCAALIVLALAFSPEFVVRQASASMVQDCQTLITALRADTTGVVITGKNAEKNRTGLLGKLDAASADLAKGKLCGAIGKLNDFRNKVNQLIASGSINSDPNVGVTGQDLVNDATEAITCLEAVVAQNGTTCPV